MGLAADSIPTEALLVPGAGTAHALQGSVRQRMCPHAFHSLLVNAEACALPAAACTLSTLLGGDHVMVKEFWGRGQTQTPRVL